MWLFTRDPVRDFPFELGTAEPDPDPDPADPAAPAPLWRLLQGRRKADGVRVSVFAHSLAPGGSAGSSQARAALRRLRSLRHPNVLGYIDSLETEQSLYLVTEEVTSLRRHLRLRPPRGPLGEQEVAWGLQQLLTALEFLGSSGLVHHNLGLYAVFVTPGGDWKLGGLEKVAGVQEGPPPPAPGLPPRPHDPPELSDPSRGQGEPWAGDMWRLGCLLWEVFNGSLPRAGALRSFGKLPPPLLGSFSLLVAAEPRQRPGPGQLLRSLRQPGAFLSCRLVDTGVFLQEMQLKDPEERRSFLQELSTHLDELPAPFLQHKLLPQLLAALQLGPPDASALPPLLQVAQGLPPGEFQRRVVPVLLKLFACPERALRIQLLRQLELFLPLVPEGTVEAEIFPQVAQGFLDTNPAIREQSIKSLVLLVPKLSPAKRAQEVPRLLLRVLGGDPLGPLRCNATLCLGRLAHLLPPQAQQRVLVPALARASRDPFPPARAAAVAAFAATHSLYPPRDCASRVLPPLCALLTDPQPTVRQQAFKAVRSFLDQLEATTQSWGELEGDPPSAAAAPGGPEGGSGGGLGAAMSWAVTSLTAKLLGGDSGAASPPAPNPPPGTPQPPAEGPPPPQKEPPPEEPPPEEPPPEDPPQEEPEGWEEDWGSLEDMELPQSPPKEDVGAAPHRAPSPPSPPTPPPQAGGDEEGGWGWGVGGEWGSEDAWEALPSQTAPSPRQQQRRREAESRRRGGGSGGVPRGPPKAGPPKLGARKRD